MAEAPVYTTVPGKIPELLKKVREVGVPPKANNSWLESVGFKSSNDRSMLKVLRYIGFIDASGNPTPAWKEYRGANHRLALGRAVQLAYENLYLMYPDAHSRTGTDIVNVFSTQTDAGKQAVEKMVSTFKALAGQAEFESPRDVISADKMKPASTSGDGAMEAPVVANSVGNDGGLSVNVNIQLTLPETTDKQVYEAFFKAMRKHLLSDEM